MAVRLGRPRVSVVPFAPPMIQGRAGRTARRDLGKAMRAYERTQRHPLRSAVTWGLWDGLRWLRRFSWNHRLGLAPLYTAAALQTTALALSGAQKGYATALILAFTGGTAMAWRLHGWNPAAVLRRARITTRPPGRLRMTRRRSQWVWSLYAAATAWLTTAAAIGAGPPMPGLLLVGALAWGGPWWWHHRIRPHDQPGDWLATWHDRVAGDGQILPGAALTDYVPADNGNWTATIDLDPGKHTTANAVQAAARIASAYRLPMSSVVVEPTEDSNASRARIAVLKSNMLEVPQEWPGPQLDLEEGIAPIGPYHDGEMAHFRFWQPDSGAWMALVSGTLGSGKSMFIGTKLATERFSAGLICSWICCPQGGQSFPEWMGNVALSVDTAEGGAEMLKWAKEVMYARSRYMATVRWTDPQGRERRGLKHFTPTPAMPLLSITIEEAHRPMAIKGAKGEPDASEDATELVNMGRKCGVGVTFVTQVPLLSQLGNSTPLRAALTSGNVVVFRTADRLSGQVSGLAAIDSEGVDPYKIPRKFKDGSQTGGLGYTLGGSDRPAMFRSYFDPDPVRWTTEGHTVPLDELSQDAMDSARGVKVDRTVVDLHSAPSAPTVGDRIVAHLAGLPHDKPIEIAKALGLDSAAVSSTLTRLDKAGKVHKVRSGWWAAGPAPAADEGERA
jgi:hypothetical protein